MFNVNHLGYYNGGVPKKGNGSTRGEAWAGPGVYHIPNAHNDMLNQHQDTATVTSEDVFKFNAWMHEDRKDYSKTRPYYTLQFDPDEKYRK